MPKTERLVARNLGCTRKQARRWLAALDRQLPPDLPATSLPLTITAQDRTLVLHDTFHLMLNKPAGCVTALLDANHTTALTYVQDAPLSAELRPVGRLDLDTTGLLLWTTDGTWLHKLTHPRSAIPRTYHVALARPFEHPPRDLVLRDGHRPNILEVRVLAEEQCHVSLAHPPEAVSFAQLTIAGGAYHEARRIFAALGSHVLGLCRVAYGAYALPPDLPPGRWLPVAGPQASEPTSGLLDHGGESQ
jgi:16S rRNA pseudouridine516 synthase